MCSMYNSIVCSGGERLSASVWLVVNFPEAHEGESWGQNTGATLAANKFRGRVQEGKLLSTLTLKADVSAQTEIPGPAPGGTAVGVVLLNCYFRIVPRPNSRSGNETNAT